MLSSTCPTRRSQRAVFSNGTARSRLASLHSTDFEKTFVCGDIMTFEDLKEYGSEVAVKAVRRSVPSPATLSFPLADDLHLNRRASRRRRARRSR